MLQKIITWGLSKMPKLKKAGSRFPILEVNELRQLIAMILIADSDLDAFCLDNFRPAHKRFTTAMDRVQKVNILLERYENEIIMQKLQEHDSKIFTSKLSLVLTNKALDPKNQSRITAKMSKPCYVENPQSTMSVSITALDSMNCRLLAREILTKMRANSTDPSQSFELTVELGLRLKLQINKTAIKDDGLMRGFRHSVEMLDLLEERLAQIQKAQEGVISFAVNFEPERREKTLQSQQHLENLRQQLSYILLDLKSA